MWGKLPYIGPEPPKGWPRPTVGLVKECLGYLAEGLAPPSAAHLRLKLEPTKYFTHQILAGEQILHSLTGSGSTIGAAGVAFPQLKLAAQQSARIVAVNMDMPEHLKKEGLTKRVRIFRNPTYTPVKEHGMVERREACFSLPGLGAAIRRWAVIDVSEDGGPPERFYGADAWVLQHEIDHLDGIFYTDRAIEQNRPIRFVPPEVKASFWDANLKTWRIAPLSYLQATLDGSFDLAAYKIYLPGHT